MGLVYIDAHGDFNTPETTLSGMLGGMDVAAAAGLCLTRLRTTSKLDPPVPVADMILAGVRDTDPLEQELIDRLKVPQMTVADLRTRGDAFRRTYAALSARVSRIYVHIDMDVLDPAEVPGHSLNVKGGPTSAELAEAVAEMFKDPKAVAIGIASTPTGERDAEGRSRKAAYTLIQAAVRGVQARPSGVRRHVRGGRAASEGGHRGALHGQAAHRHAEAGLEGADVLTAGGTTPAAVPVIARSSRRRARGWRGRPRSPA